MRAAGLLATLNTDDPALIELDLGTEYRSVAEACALLLQSQQRPQSPTSPALRSTSGVARFLGPVRR
jgi:adenosine deaminase